MSERAERNRVIITGMAGRMGKRLLRTLHRERPVSGLGRRLPSSLPLDVSHEAFDPLRNRARAVFSAPDVGAIVHLGVIHDPRDKRAQEDSLNIRSLQTVLDYAKEFRIPKVVFLSSANAYGPRAENAQFLSEEAPLLASGRFTEMRELVELDMLAQSYFWRNPNTELVILRPANILGTVHNAPSNYLRMKRVPTLLGFDPMLQAVHEDDVVQALCLALKPGIKGVFNIAGPPQASLSSMLKMLERETLPMPYSLAKGGLGGLFALGVTKFPAAELDFIKFVCMVDDKKARQEMGYRPRYDLQQTLNAVDQFRWVDKHD